MMKTSPVPTGAVSAQLPGVSIAFHARPPHTRFDVVISSPVGHELDGELTNALSGIGFKAERPQRADGDGMVSQSFDCEGDGLCGGWTAAERDRLTRNARHTLRRFGFTMIPEIRTT
jgi:hypothetical protein